MKKIVVVGAGPGGLAAAMLLAAKGYDVSVFEKQPYVGGRNGRFELGPYRFDIGPTFLSMPHIIEELFTAARRNIHDYVKLVELDPMYELIFTDVKLAMTMNRKQMKEQISTLFPGDEDGYERFMNENERKLQALAPILQSKMDRLYHYLRPTVLKALPQLTLSQSLYDILSRYFHDERLRLAFTFQAKYLGMSPWECPGAFSILSYMEHAYGIYHVIGGLNEISKAMARIVEEYGGSVHVNTGVRKLWLDGRTVKGVILENGEKVEADVVIMNADLLRAYRELVDPHARSHERAEPSISAFVMLVGTKQTRDDLAHHNVFFSANYKQEFDHIFAGRYSEDPTIYVCAPPFTNDGTSLFVLVNAPPLTKDGRMQVDEHAYKQLVYEKLRSYGLDIVPDVEKVITPLHIAEQFGAYRGALYGIASNRRRDTFLRPSNACRRVKGLYFVGGTTHPGGGSPMVVISGQNVANHLLGVKLSLPF